MAGTNAKNRRGVLISGAYGLGNPGDEAILEAILARIKEADSSIPVTVLSRDPANTAERFRTRALKSFDIIRIIRTLKSCSLLISGGGSLLQNSTSTRSLLYYLFVMKLARAMGCKVLMYGCGIGPIKGNLCKKLAAKIIDSCADCITLRDNGALESLKELGIQERSGGEAGARSVLVTADPVFSLQASEKKDADRAMEAFGISEDDPFIAIAVKDCPDFAGKEDVIVSAAAKCYSGHGLKSVFIASSEEDKALAERICGSLETPYRIISGSFGAGPVIALLQKARALVSVRLHYLIFAAIAGTPSAALSYDPKVSGFMKELGCGSCVELKDITEESLTGLIEEAITKDRAEILAAASALREREAANGRVLLDMIGRPSEDSLRSGPVRIAFFTTDFGVGGMQRSLVNILKKLDLTRCKADVYYTSDGSFFDLPQREGLRYIKIQPRPYWFRFVHFSLLKLFSKPFAPEEEYDVAVDFNSYQNDCALMAVQCNAKRRVMFVHNDVRVKLAEEPRYRVLWHFFKSKFRYFDEFAAVSTRIVESFRECSHTNAPIWTIPNYIDTEEIFQKADQVHPLHVDQTLYNVCAVGRLCHQKGIDILLDIFAKAAHARPDLHLYLIGDGPDREALHNQARDLGIDLRVTFLGTMRNPYVVMNKMDALVLTSRYEGQGMVVLEAKALGLDLYVARSLEGCNPGIPCCDDIEAALLSADKHAKQRDSLAAYNNNITRQLNRIFRI